jgi:hypothetical protein
LLDDAATGGAESVQEDERRRLARTIPFADV